ncbi:diaminopimelate epimerase [Gammaproteobacteria bacterium]|nr:diaminopimelate epimerase [Gammaproteobacteria bacterium]
MPFTKMQALGNDFVVLDRISHSMTPDPALMRRLADRRSGVGCDQLLLIEAPRDASHDLYYRIFNHDGSEVGQCGNGVRCVARYALENGLLTGESVRLQTDTARMVVERDGDDWRVDMGEPRFAPSEVPIDSGESGPTHQLTLSNGERISAFCLSVGNPHAVTVHQQLDAVNVLKIGAELESHPAFPERVNVGFAELIDTHHIRLRVFERGVGETLACGSGACAAAVALIDSGHADDTISVELPGGTLRIAWRGRGHPILMTGPAAFVFNGEFFN